MISMLPDKLKAFKSIKNIKNLLVVDNLKIKNSYSLVKTSLIIT
jgi:hypothetical protein